MIDIEWDDKHEPDLVIHLIHGTWAPAAGWVERNSQLRSSLIMELKPQTIKFCIFKWSGKNRISARHEAAGEFITHVGNSIEDNPNSRHIVIGHSHGGSVAYAALGRDPILAKKVSLLICLSTPFIHVRRRYSNENQFSWTLVSFIAIGWIAMLIAMLKNASIAEQEAINFGVPFGLIQAAAALWLLVSLVGAPLLFSAFREKLKKFDLEVQGRVLMASKLNVKGIFIRATGDEASSFIAFPQLVSTVLSELIDKIRTMSPPSEWPEILVKTQGGLISWYVWLFQKALIAFWVFGLSMSVSIPLEKAIFGQPEATILHPIVLVIVVVLYFILERKGIFSRGLNFVWRIFLAISTLPINFLSALMGIFVGYEYMLASRRLILSVEHSPPGAHEVVILQDATLESQDWHQFQGRGGLRHSIAYSSLASIDVICKSIRSV